MADEGDENEEISSGTRNEMTEKDRTCDNNENSTKYMEMLPPLNPVVKSGENNKTDLQPDKNESFNFKFPSINKDLEGHEDLKSDEKSDLQKKEKAPELRYKVPWWSAKPPQEQNFNLEMLKNGCIISTTDLNDKAFYVFGRLALCDIVLEHPSISRYHALIQYRGDADGDKTLSGFYLYDLGSTHGTLVNKAKIRPKTYYRLKVGYVIKFGGSSRLFVLQGPTNDDDGDIDEVQPSPASANTTAVNVGQIFTDEEYESLKKVEQKSEPSEGIDWGFGEDAEEEHIDSEKFEELYSGVEFKDPKKTLRGYYEREGLELEYLVDETGPGHARVYHCRVRLPVDGPNGSAVYAEASVSGRKKEAVKECANEACKMLDAYGLLRQSNHESRKKRERNLEEDDFYESDEDNFLDRTGTVETKRLKRMTKVGKDKSEIDTYHSLLEKLQKVEEEKTSLEKQINDAVAIDEAKDEDSLDNFMNTISLRMDKGTKIKLKNKIIGLKKEEERLTKLIAIVKPADLPVLQSTLKTETSPTKMDKTEEINKNKDLQKKAEQNEEIKKNMNEASDQDKLNGEDPTLEKNSEPVHHAKKMVPPVENAPFTEFAIPLPNTKPTTSKKSSKTKDNRKRNKVEDKQESKIDTKNHPSTVKETNEIPEAKTEKDDVSKDDSPVSEKKKRYTAPTQWEDANDPNYANWVPPEDQSGDGRTKLNDKYGY